MRQRSGYLISVALLIAAAALDATSAQASIPASWPLTSVSATPAWTVHQKAVGAASAGQQETATVYLRQPRIVAAERFAAEVSDPRSALYRHFLSPAQYRTRFAPGSASVAAVSGYLRAQGLRIAAVPANHLYIQASGTVGQMQNAFHTALMTYEAGGTPVVAPAAALRLPTSVARDVAGVAGLDTRVTTAVRTSPAATSVTCSAYTFQHTAVLPTAYGRTVFPTQGCGYTPAPAT